MWHKECCPAFWLAYTCLNRTDLLLNGTCAVKRLVRFCHQGRPGMCWRARELAWDSMAARQGSPTNSVSLVPISASLQVRMLNIEVRATAE